MLLDTGHLGPSCNGSGFDLNGWSDGDSHDHRYSLKASLPYARSPIGLNCAQLRLFSSHHVSDRLTNSSSAVWLKSNFAWSLAIRSPWAMGNYHRSILWLELIWNKEGLFRPCSVRRILCLEGMQGNVVAQDIDSSPHITGIMGNKEHIESNSALNIGA